MQPVDGNEQGLLLLLTTTAAACGAGGRRLRRAGPEEEVKITGGSSIIVACGIFGLLRTTTTFAGIERGTVWALAEPLVLLNSCCLDLNGSDRGGGLCAGGGCLSLWGW